MSTNKMKLALKGSVQSPKLFTALQLGYGLAGAWEKMIVIGSSDHDGQYQHIGGYNTLRIARDATPQRYTELLNLAASCGKEVVILSGLSNEWTYGVLPHLGTNYYDDVLRSHRLFVHAMKHAPVHVIALIDTRTIYLHKNGEGRRKLRQEQLVQQLDITSHFITALDLDKRGSARVEKDGTKSLPPTEPFKPSLHHGALLADWCRRGDPVISWELQRQIDQCATIADLYQLLFSMDVDDLDMMTAFTRRRLELDEDRKEPILDLIPGGLL